MQNELNFDKCPACGEAAGFVKSLADAVKARGLMRNEYNPPVYLIRGIVRDPEKEAALVIGSCLPVFEVHLEVCSKCGCVYGTRLIEGEATKSLPPIEQQMPQFYRKDN